MDIYKHRFGLKIALLIVGAVIVILTVYYSNYFSSRLAEKEKESIENYAVAVKSLSSAPEEGVQGSDILELTLKLMVKVNNPMILDYGDGDLEGKNWGDQKDNDQKFLLKKKLEIQKNGLPPISPFDYIDVFGNNVEQYPKIYYENSLLHTMITWFPFIQVALIIVFVLFGYMIFNTMRRAEQNRVWVGMSKETAHQLGTPISGIIGWTEYLKVTEPTEDQIYAISEMENDVKKLELIADRFSKIGSVPDLKVNNVNEIIQNSIDYIKKRSPQNIEFKFVKKENVLNANINDHLFAWVIENLLRNSLDAMPGKGKITITSSQKAEHIIIDVCDTGKGIPQGKLKTVFTPGYSTKKRGWGLGLSLAKRIIHDYHKGKIFVLKSKVNEGTTFRINLPKT